ncbi:MAG: GNAT family N-acetyltransferase [Deltaproteobacteria bacterium]|nr:GNAT family N-acetyltransferase [Deltaproteobacteria bacterium]MBW2421711.1 GNAT family N-acetyltransferase [Deltaproteobacteria bacterium]
MTRGRLTSRPGITLQPARHEGPESDLEFLYQVYASSREDEVAQVTTWTDAQKEAFLRSQFELQHRHYHEHYPGARYDLVLEEGRPIGRYPIGRYYVEPMEKEIRIMDVALLRAFRGRGIGRSLVQDVLDEAGASGRFVSLHVEENNPARRLYARMGFRDHADVGVYKLMHWAPDGQGES